MQLKPFLTPQNLYFFSLCLLAIGLPLSHFLISVSQFVMGFAWVWDGRYREKITRFLNNKAALLIVGVLLLHIAGLLYTSNFSYALKDLRVKLPLFVLPFIISGFKPLDPKRTYLILSLFVGAVFMGTLASMGVLLGFINRQITDIRDVSLFISHIRFSLLICLAVYFVCYDLYLKKSPLFPVNLLKALLIAWFILFLIILQSVTGIAILIITALIVLFILIVRIKKVLPKILLGILFLLLPLGSYFFLEKAVSDFYTIHWEYQQDLEEFTAKGNRYSHNTAVKEFENGYPIWVYISWEELKEAWNKRSRFDFEGKDKKGQDIKFTLIRFLTSKGYRKDAQGVAKLTSSEVASIENGISNVNYRGIFNFRGRIQVIIWEYDNYSRGGNPSGHSVTQRFEFWKAAAGIIKENPVTGVGTGDVRDEFRRQYIEMNSSLSERWRLYSHNQYISFAVAFGITGLCYFLCSLLYPVYLCWKRRDFLYFIFWMILVISMFTEDTLETQAGVTFYAFFNSFLLFGKNEKL